MLSLPELQGHFAKALLGEARPDLLAMIEPDGLGARNRLQVYANHFRVSLIEALATAFPVTRRLVGADCFTQVARQYALRHPPASPCLAEYGQGFPAFLAALRQLRGVPYLGGVARLERALAEAQEAPEAAERGYGADALMALWTSAAADRLLIALAPSVRMVASRFPVDQIWQAHQADDVADEPLRLEPRGARLLVQRDADGDVGWLRLGRPEFALLHTIEGGAPLGRAVRLARVAQPAFDPVPFLQALTGAGALVDAVLLMPDQRRLP